MKSIDQLWNRDQRGHMHHHGIPHAHSCLPSLTPHPSYNLLFTTGYGPIASLLVFTSLLAPLRQPTLLSLLSPPPLNMTTVDHFNTVNDSTESNGKGGIKLEPLTPSTYSTWHKPM